jgi:hypothetical protein
MTSSLMSSEAKAAVLILLYRSPRPALAVGGSADSTRMMSIAPAAHSPCYPCDKRQHRGQQQCRPQKRCVTVPTPWIPANGRNIAIIITSGASITRDQCIKEPSV